MRLGVREVAHLFEVTERTVYRWVREEALPAHEVEGQSRFHRAEVLEWATARDITPSPEIFDAEATSPETSIAAALRRGGIHRLAPNDHEEALGGLVAHLPISDVDRTAVHEVLGARAGLGKTGAGDGIAIPHVRHPIVLDVADAIVTLCFLEHALVFPSEPAPVRTVFVLVTPSVHAHLTMLSRLAFAVREPHVRAVLERRGTDAEVLAALELVEQQSVGRAAPAEAAERAEAAASEQFRERPANGVDLREPEPRSRPAP